MFVPEHGSLYSKTNKLPLFPPPGRLTPSEEGGQAPAQRVHPGAPQDEQRPLARHHPDGGQRPRDHEVPVHRDDRERDHGADAKQSATERVQLTT